MADALEQLNARLAEYQSLDSIASILTWDQRTIMPPGGFVHRGGHIAALESIAQRLDAVGSNSETESGTSPS